MNIPTTAALEQYEHIGKIKDSAYEVVMLERAIARTHDNLAIAHQAVVNLAARLDRQQREYRKRNRALTNLINPQGDKPQS